MLTGELKAFVAALLLPPAGPLLLAMAGLLLARAGRRIGWGLAAVALVGLWLLSCHAVSLELGRRLLPQVPPVSLVELRRARVQAVVVLGGGVQPEAPEYGQPLPSAHTLARLRYGVRLARQAGLPLGFSGGAGWSGRGAVEAEAARRSARQDFGAELRWVDGSARDTAENAQQLAPLLRRDGITRIALVSDAWHLPRARLQFERMGFEVLPAPTGLAAPRDRDGLEWLPSGHGLAQSRQLLREWLAFLAVQL